VFPKPSDPDGRRDGEWLSNALFGRMPPKAKSKEVRPPGWTDVQCINLGWLPNPVDTSPVIGAYKHLPISSMFRSFFLHGLGDYGCSEKKAGTVTTGLVTVTPVKTTPKRKTIDDWGKQIHDDPTLAPDDKPFLWRVFVVTALFDKTLGDPPSFGPSSLPVLTLDQRKAYKKYRDNRDRLSLDVSMYYLPVFTFVTNVLGAAFPGP
jgi:hypothetical protein